MPCDDMKYIDFDTATEEERLEVKGVEQIRRIKIALDDDEDLCDMPENDKWQMAQDVYLIQSGQYPEEKMHKVEISG